MLLGNPGALRDETLVYFIRVFHRNDDIVMVNDLAEVLITRWQGWIRSKAGGLSAGDADDLYGTVIKGLFERILDLDTDRGDYFQCKFGHALKRLTISALRPYYRASTWESKNIIKPTTDEEVESELDIDEIVADPSMSIEKKVLLADALSQIPQPHGMAYVLHHGYGWQIESKDPMEPTLSKHFQVTPRTIRNWITTAEKHLSQWRGEE